LGVPVTVGPSIILGLFALGVLSRLSGAYLVEWIVLGFAALLIHELGHALAFRRYGVESAITFWLLGGYTVPTDQDAAARLDDRQLLVVSIAGPLFGLVVGAVSLAVAVAARGQGADVRVPLFLWLFVNLGWAVFNLLPIASLDGGQALRHLGGAAFGRPGRAIGLVLGLLASAAIVAASVDYGLYSIAIVAAVFGLFNPTPYLELRDEIWPPRQRREPEPSVVPPPGRAIWARADEGLVGGRGSDGAGPGSIDSDARWSRPGAAQPGVGTPGHPPQGDDRG
jgi:stage IV sporulation protein FB